ncbi:MAG: flagellar basal-body rod protein FlgF [Desulfocapsaceae bacterium]|jgi:flagellar basal-body rod protein FlgF/flagellar basal-body rod protein FlgG|nr:flagellar basal-body rod protein FlgF [Desulfocapsaceae bacterium]MDP3695478.1 flagellar basal-body rod protein FlgF [Desulfocapsaceae bacterium]
MVSGKYSALSGAVAREQSMANIAANLANVNTTGYKKANVSFESLLQGAKQTNEAKGINYSRIKGNFTEFSSGPMVETGNPLDMAIHGDGFFKVQGPNGVLYTRRGDFVLDQNGNLQTSNGMAVLDGSNGPINIPDTTISQISISSLGEISTMGRDGSRSVVGSIGVVTINDTSKLKREADTTFSLQADGQETVATEPTLVIGNLETSNVNMTEEMTMMIDSLRTFETYHKVLKSYSDLGQKQDELGSLG